MPLSYLPKSEQENQWMYRYSPFRNIGPQPSYEEMDYNEKRRADNRAKLEGQIFHTKQGYDIKIVDYMDVHNVIVQFVCDGFLKLTCMSNIKKGLVWYPFERNQYGGYAGNGYYNQGNNKQANSIWYNMLQRATPEFWADERFKKYTGTKICQEWYNFQNFAAWYTWYRSCLNPSDEYKYQIDKDIFQWGLPEKIYSPYTCTIIPKTLNAALESMDRERDSDLPKGVDYLGPGRFSARCSYGTTKSNGVYLGTFKTPEEAFLAYKKEKESYLRQLVDKYLLEGAIVRSVRDAVYNIEIEPYGV